MNFLKQITNKFKHLTGQSELDDKVAQQIERKNEMLRNLLTYARQNSPWYRKILKNVSIDTMTCDHLRELPTITKTTFMENWDDIVTDKSLNLKKVSQHLNKMSNTEEIVPLDDKYVVFSTGGSTGKKGIFVYPIEGVRLLAYLRSQRLKKSMMPYLNLQEGEILRIAEVVATNAVYGMYARSKIYSSEDELKHFYPITKPMAEIIEGLNKFQPHRVNALPSTARLLCKFAQAGELTINPNIMGVGAEPLYEPIREMIYKTWPKIKLFNYYGTTEGVAAGNCKPNSFYMHLNDSRAVFFPVNQCNQIVNRGDYADKLIFTNLNSYTLPLINYEIEDRIRFVPESCSCGSLLPLIEEPKGRAVQDFIYPGNIIVHYLVFSTPLLTDPHVIEFHVKQTPLGAEINIVSNGPVNKQKIVDSIRQTYSKLGLHNAQIEVRDVPEMSYLPSGKLRRFTPLE
ncbi:phenylacetate--CoA ligase family protein [Legionella feeleii]|uniref:Coenzyme F390 synthetase n=1 Tax=Legionella feeleii TaxID=453 RepID=A0A0W0TU67_9GAMM|nr:phenylacetate--CoA ligase family protein [Legionella feeleii]KTC99218.1 coenzyme F390 synthetase [Legionella feeleii]SPX61074.1 Coenzyme F390 synthetase [Legionella feeleii]